MNMLTRPSIQTVREISGRLALSGDATALPSFFQTCLGGILMMCPSSERSANAEAACALVSVTDVRP